MQALSLSMVLIATPAYALLSVGPVELAGHLRALDTRLRSVECTAPDGERIRWESDAYDIHHYDTEFILWKRVYDIGLGEFDERVIVRWADWETGAMGCASDGGVVIASGGYYGTLLVERFDREGHLSGSRKSETVSWSHYGKVQVEVPGESFLAFLEPWRDAPETELPSRQLAVLRHSVDDDAVGPTVVAEWDIGIEMGLHAAAADSDGSVLLAWTLVKEGEAPQLWIRPVDAFGTPLGEAERIDDPGIDVNSTLRVLSTGPGAYLVAWKDALPGWVGRRVRLNEGHTTSTTSTTTTTLDSEVFPDFLPPLTISEAEGLRGTPDLATDGKGKWIVAWRASDLIGRTIAWIAMSANDGRTWSAPLGFPVATIQWQEQPYSDGDAHDVALATDGEGTWILALLRQADQEECHVELWRSSDDGRSWESPADSGSEHGYLGRFFTWNAEYDDQVCGGMDLAHLAHQYWILVLGAVADESQYFDSRVLSAAASGTGGDLWSGFRRPFEDARNEPAASAPLIVPRGSIQDALIVWRTHSVRALSYGALDREGGSLPDTWLPASDVAEINDNQPFGLAFTTDPLGTMVLAFPHRDEENGWDPDIMVSRSADAGETWTEPERVFPDAVGDGATDVAPAMASDAGGNLLLAWNTNRGDVRPLASAPSVVASISSDAGLSWSHPLDVNTESSVVSAADSVVAVAPDLHGGWGVLMTSRFADGRTELRLVRTRGSCGNGSVEAEELCDNGNLEDDDGCDSNCTLPACGNGILGEDEDCDDGNPWEGDACRADCTLARCGDGVEQVVVEQCDDGNTDASDSCTTECRLPRCGDGFVQSGVEECEDGNTINGDGCDENCLFTRCGNGVVTDGEQCDRAGAPQGSCRLDCTLNECGDGWLGSPDEQCDDANGHDDDECRNNCQRQRCLDGHLYAPYEECDDGNSLATDGCTRECRLPACGDDVLSRDVEDCEDGNSATGDGCTPECQWEDLCGDADASGRVTPIDSLRILHRSIERPVSCAAWACDANGVAGVSATDAALVLRKSVGIDVATDCHETIVVHAEAAAVLLGVQFTMDYSRALGTLHDDTGKLRCRWLIDGGLYVLPRADRMLHLSFLGSDPVPASIDLLECRMRRYAEPVEEEFVPVVESAVGEGYWDVGTVLSVVRSHD